MRTLHVMFAALALAAAPACKNQTEKQADRVEKARDDVKEQSKDVTEARRDVNRQQRELDRARVDLDDARIQYQNVLKERLATIDMKLDELATRTDAMARDEVAALRLRRDELSRRIDAASTTAADAWTSFKKNVNDTFKKLEDDIDSMKPSHAERTYHTPPGYVPSVEPHK